MNKESSININDFIGSTEFRSLSSEEQQITHIVKSYGTNLDQIKVMDPKKRSKILGFNYVGFHEMGHAFAAGEAGGRDIRAKILGIGRGVTTWMHSFKSNIEQFFSDRMFVAFAGRKAIEALGLSSKGHGSDMAQIDYQADIYSLITGKSGQGLRFSAEIRAESFVRSNITRIVREGLMLADEAA